MRDSYRQLKNELLDQSTYTLKEVEHRLDMVMLHAAEVVNEMHDPRMQEPSCFAIAAKLREEV